ncbi:hypothetical protein [Pseudoxanthomonas putridarboris]|uniref:GyrI-like small molecule binding domain-containing protein n=1 Tax=Pseudoxanthomonas putridarboris TaxID=752605 RepID=A0ABU9IYC5_9GAMM
MSRSVEDPLKTIYLDREFIANLYEQETGNQPETKISTSETLHATAKIPLFSGGASSAETRTYSVSIRGMLEALKAKLSTFPDEAQIELEHDKPSVYMWVSGVLSINVLKRSRKMQSEKTGRQENVVLAEVPYYALEKSKYKFALIPSEDYFQSGFRGLRELHNTVLGPIDLPVNALLRVVSAQTNFNQWIAIPLIIYES